MRGRWLRSAWAAIVRFLKREEGVLTILSLLFFVMLLTMAGLAIDLGRLYGERGQMQAYVDHAALSSASQLDRSSDAITRAMCAVIGTGDSTCTAAKLVSGSEKFSTTKGDLDIQKLTFLDWLDPAWMPGDATPTAAEVSGNHVLCTYDGQTHTFDSGCNTNLGNNANAQFVEVVAKPRTVAFFLIPLQDFIGAFFGSTGTITKASLALKATAGYKQVLCDNVPLMVCNPDEATNGAGADFDVNNRDKGKQLYAYGQMPGGGSIGPGMFGLLATYGSGGNAIRDAFAKSDPNTICTSVSVPPKTGVTTGPSRQGINVRFDETSGSTGTTEAAPVVTKGLVTTNCNNYQQSADTMPFPRDSCFMSGGQNSTDCDAIDRNGIYRMGKADWNRQAYWLTNHGEAWPPPDWNTYWSSMDPTGSHPAATATRYEVYRYEIDHPTPDNLDEKRAPICSTAGSADRRVFTIAVVNCETEDVTNTSVPIKAYAQVFLTEPVGDMNQYWSGKSRGGLTWPTSGSNSDIYVEVIGVVHPGDSSGKLHQFPILYR